MRAQEFDFSRIQRANEWIADHGIAAFSQEECHQIFPYIVEQVHAKETFPSLLTTRSPGDVLLPQTNALIIETGGTKNRARDISASEFMDQNSPKASQRDMIEMTFPRTVFRDAEDFFDTIITLTEPAIATITHEHPVHALAVVFSFPGPAVKTAHGVDIMPSAKMSKKFVVPGIENYPVGATILRKLRERGYIIRDDLAVIVTNDVVGGMIYHPNVHFSLIDGTGFNIGVTKKTGGTYSVFGTESGDVDMPLSRVEYEINRTGDNPGRYQAETIAGGTHIADQLNYNLSHLHREGIIPYENEPVTAVHLTEILSGNRPAFTQILRGFKPKDTSTWNILAKIATPIRDRAAVTMGMILAAQILAHPEAAGTDGEVTCTTEGSTLLFVPGLLDDVLEIAEYFSGRRIKFLLTSGAKGAGFAALRQYARMHT